MQKFKIFLRFSKYLRPHWSKVLGMLVCTGVATLMAMASPIITKIMLDTVFPQKNGFLLVVLILAGIGLRFLGSANSVWNTYLSTRMNTGVTFALRTDFYRHLQKLSLSFFDSRGTGEHMFRATQDIGSVVGMVTGTFPSVMQAVFRLTVLLVITLRLDWKLTLVCMTVVPVVWLNSNLFSKKIRELNRTMQEQLSHISTRLQQAISGVRLVKAFGKEQKEAEAYSNDMRASLETQVKSSIVRQMYSASGGLIHVLWSSSVSLYCGFQVINGTLTVGEMMGLTLYVLQLYGPISSFLGTYVSVQRQLVSAERVLETLDVVPDIVDAPHAIALPLRGDIRFEGVRFGYEPDRPVLRGVDFTIPAGSTVALVGSSGIGKTTIASLLLRFYDPWKGRVCLDGHDLKQLKLQSVKDQIGVVLQEPFLDNGTVKDNIRYGKEDATHEEVVGAAEIANAHEFIQSLPEGYDTDIGERGVRLSEGQRQRIALARAIIRDPRILILDEPTSSLDGEAEAKVRKALEESGKARTVLIIAHRLSTILMADRIMLLDDGHIVEEGTHEELMARKGRYYDLYAYADRAA